MQRARPRVLVTSERHLRSSSLESCSQCVSRASKRRVFCLHPPVCNGCSGLGPRWPRAPRGTSHTCSPTHTLHLAPKERDRVGMEPVFRRGLQGSWSEHGSSSVSVSEHRECCVAQGFWFKMMPSCG